MRKLAAIGTNGWQYRQACMLITVDTGAPQQDVTRQRFFPSGPRAFLPLYDSWASLVWYDSPQRIRQLQAMPPAQLERGSPPLSRRDWARSRCTPPVRSADAASCAALRAAGVGTAGDAAHTINPLAGQGVNLGYRDVDALLNVLSDAREQERTGAARRYCCVISAAAVPTIC